MNLAIYQSSSAMSGLERWQAMLSHNIANSQTAGYKRSQAVFESEKGEMQGEAPKQVKGSQKVGVIPEVRGARDNGAGNVRQTGNPLDFVIRGEGYFQVENAEGDKVYTRDGQFQVSDEGALGDKNGHRVIGDGGPINVLPTGEPLSLSPDGQLYQGNTPLQRLTLHAPELPEQLVRAPGGFREAEPDAAMMQVVEEGDVRQGAIEMSNVEPVREMVDLIAVSRAYEANRKVITSTDELLGQAVKSLGVA